MSRIRVNSSGPLSLHNGAFLRVQSGNVDPRNLGQSRQELIFADFHPLGQNFCYGREYLFHLTNENGVKYGGQWFGIGAHSRPTC